MRILALILCLCLLPVEAAALQIEAPPVPRAGEAWMPRNTNSLPEGLLELGKKAVTALKPDLQEAARVCLGILAAVLLVSLLQNFSAGAGKLADPAGTTAVAVMALGSANSMLRLATCTLEETASYGKLLLPVMTTALAAQGGITSSAALYAGTAMFTAVLQAAMDAILVPGIWLYLALCAGNAATGEGLLKKAGDLCKGFIGWSLKILLILFTSYLSLTKVVSGATDAAALKAAKVSMSSFIPVVGGILSEASEAVLVSAGLMKNAAGIYGILAVLALTVHPFLKIGLHYLLLKITAGVCSLFGTSRITGLIDCFASSLGMLLGMTGASCVMVLISTVCFMKGVG